jgi:hypothetical protein
LRGYSNDSQRQSIKVVKSAMHVTTAQAKSLVDRNEAWSDRYVDDRALHAALREAAEKLKDEGGGADLVIEDRPVDPDSQRCADPACENTGAASVSRTATAPNGRRRNL